MADGGARGSPPLLVHGCKACGVSWRTSRTRGTVQPSCALQKRWACCMCTRSHPARRWTRWPGGRQEHASVRSSMAVKNGLSSTGMPALRSALAYFIKQAFCWLRRCCHLTRRRALVETSGRAPPSRTAPAKRVVHVAIEVRWQGARRITRALESLDFSRPIALCFGNERLGVSRELLRACDLAFTIPLRGLSESLNVSVAAAIAMHWGRVAREAALGEESRIEGDLPPDERSQLEEEYCARGNTRGFVRDFRRSVVARDAAPRDGAVVAPQPAAAPGRVPAEADQGSTDVSPRPQTCEIGRDTPRQYAVPSLDGEGSLPLGSREDGLTVSYKGADSNGASAT